jgi:hypothetical protein
MTAAAAQEASSPADLGSVRERLGGLVRHALGDVPISHARPGQSDGADGAVGLYLLAFEADSLPARQTHMLQFAARFLVTVHHSDPILAGERLAALLFEALEEPDLDVGLEPVTPAAWQALGAPPQPCFTVSMPLRQRRNPRTAALVREAVLRLTSGGVLLRGQVVGDDDTPVANASIELPAMQTSTHTDAHGNFQLANVPAGRVRLRVIARGRAAIFELQAQDNDTSPVTLRIALARTSS